MKYSYSIVNTLLNMPDTNVCILDEEHRITNYSQSFANLIKKNTNIDIEKGMSIFDTALNDELKKKMKEDVNYVLKHKYFNEFETDDNYIFNKSYSIIEDNNTHLGILIIYNVIQDTCNINYKQQYELMVFKNIANNLPVGIALIDHKSDDRPVLFVNKKFEHLTGYKKNEMLGKSCMVIKNNKINKKANQTVNQTIKNKQSCEVEIKHFTKSGKEIYNLINVSPLLDNEKNVLYYMIILQDITESIEYRKQNTIKRLAEGLTHEINTAIFSIKGNLEMLLDDVNAIEDDDKKNIMLDSLQNIRKSKRIIQDIVKTLHYTNDVGENNKSLISINNSIKDSLKNYEDKIERNDIDIFIDIDKELNINFEPKTLRHLWQILIDNTIDALIEKNEERKISINALKDDNKIIIVFSDNGHGIDPNIINDIFKPLTKGKSYGGVGIGLFVAKMIVDNNGGNISFTTSEKGTTFRLLFDTSNSIKS